MKRMQLITGAVAALGLVFAASAANAATAITSATFDPFQVILPGNEELITQFEGGPGLINVTFLKTGYALSGTGGLFTGTVPLEGLAPAFSSTTRDETQYLLVQGGQSVKLTTPGIRGLSFYTGTHDTYNSITFTFNDNSTETLTGRLRNIAPFTSDGQTYTGQQRDGRLHFAFSKVLVDVELTSGGNAFEVSDFAASTAVPEPATWALMILGFGGAGAMLRRRRAVTA